MPSPQRMCFFPSLPVPFELPVSTVPAHPCPYLPGLTAVSRGFRCGAVPGVAYQELMDAGFRRAGDAFYQMVCPGCRACTPLRVPVRGFSPAKSQRRVLRKNADLSLSVGRPELTDEKHALYRRYLESRHDGRMSSGREELEEFLYRSPTRTLEFTYREPGGGLVAVGLCDQTPLALSSVYFYFEPEEAWRSLGTFGSLTEIEVARALGLPYYYLGLWVEGCAKMEYKARLRPCELLGTDGVWRAFGELAAT